MGSNPWAPVTCFAYDKRVEKRTSLKEQLDLGTANNPVYEGY